MLYLLVVVFYFILFQSSQLNSIFFPFNQEISKKYADVYLPFEDGTVVLQHHGKSWNVRCCLTKQNSKRFLKGWRQFAGDNKLHLGDICLFDLLKDKKKYVMDVHIIRRKLNQYGSLSHFCRFLQVRVCFLLRLIYSEVCCAADTLSMNSYQTDRFACSSKSSAMTFVFARSNCDGGGAMAHHVNENVVHDQWRIQEVN